MKYKIFLLYYSIRQSSPRKQACLVVSVPQSSTKQQNHHVSRCRMYVQQETTKAFIPGSRKIFLLKPFFFFLVPDYFSTKHLHQVCLLHITASNSTYLQQAFHYYFHYCLSLVCCYSSGSSICTRPLCEPKNSEFNTEALFQTCLSTPGFVRCQGEP